MFSKVLFPLEISHSLSDIINRSKLIGQLGGKSIHLLHVINTGFGNKEQVQSKFYPKNNRLHC